MDAPDGCISWMYLMDVCHVCMSCMHIVHVSKCLHLMDVSLGCISWRYLMVVPLAFIPLGSFMDESHECI